MSWADSRLLDDVKLYEKHIEFPDGTEVVRYAYGAPWVAAALFMDDIYFDTPEAAREWWERRYG